MAPHIVADSMPGSLKPYGQAGGLPHRVMEPIPKSPVDIIPRVMPQGVHGRRKFSTTVECNASWPRRKPSRPARIVLPARVLKRA